MDKESSIISWIKNKIRSIISRLWKRKTDAGISEDKDQLIDREEVSGEKKKARSIIREAMEKLLEFEGMVEESRKDIINKILVGISSLEDEYDKRLTGLEKDINELKGEKGKEGSAAFDFIPSKEEYLYSIGIDAQLEGDLNNEIIPEKLKNEFKTKKEITLSENAAIIKEKEDRWVLTNKEKIYCIRKQDGMFLVYERSKGVVEPESSIRKEHLEKIVKTLPEESEIVDLKDKIDTLRGVGLLDISVDKIKGITTALDYLGHAPPEVIKAMTREIKESKVENWIEKIGDLYGMGSINIKDEKLDKELKRVRLILGIVSLLPEKGKGIPKLDEVNTQLIDVIAQSKKHMSEMYIRLLYSEGVMLLKTGAFRRAYECFNEITIINPSRKGAWLNRGFAAGGFGDIDKEIESYEKALNLDEGYGKARKNMRIPKIKKWITKTVLHKIRPLREEKSEEPMEVNGK